MTRLTAIEEGFYQKTSDTMSLSRFIDMFWDNAMWDALFLMTMSAIGYIVVILIASINQSSNTSTSTIVKLKKFILGIIKHAFGIVLSAIFVSYFLYAIAWITSDMSYFPREYMKGNVFFQLLGVTIFTSILSIKTINSILKKIKKLNFKKILKRNNNKNSQKKNTAMKNKFNKLNNWYTKLNTKQRFIIWALSLPTIIVLVGIPWVLILVYMEFHRN